MRELYIIPLYRFPILCTGNFNSALFHVISHFFCIKGDSVSHIFPKVGTMREVGTPTFQLLTNKSVKPSNVNRKYSHHVIKAPSNSDNTGVDYFATNRPRYGFLP